MESPDSAKHILRWLYLYMSVYHLKIFIEISIIYIEFEIREYTANKHKVHYIDYYINL